MLFMKSLLLTQQAQILRQLKSANGKTSLMTAGLS